VELLLKTALKNAEFCSLGGTIEFKKDIPCGIPFLQEYDSTIKADDNVIYYIVEGERGELIRCLNDIFSQVTVLHLDALNHGLFLPEFHELANPKVFENEYVRICS